MATITIIEHNEDYVTVEVCFAEQTLMQTLISSKRGLELEQQLQAYADDYETAWRALPQETAG